jgi:hypothetical protein
LGGFVDDVGGTLTPYVKHRPFIVIERSHSLGDICDCQRVTRVLSHEPDFTTALTLEEANGTECNHRRLTGSKDDKKRPRFTPKGLKRKS